MDFPPGPGKNDERHSSITITGNAENKRDGAVVVAADKTVYYIDGITNWEEKWLNQRVKITGDLDERTIREAVILLL